GAREILRRRVRRIDARLPVAVAGPPAQQLDLGLPRRIAIFAVRVRGRRHLQAGRDGFVPKGEAARLQGRPAAEILLEANPQGVRERGIGRAAQRRGSRARGVSEPTAHPDNLATSAVLFRARCWTELRATSAPVPALVTSCPASCC